MGVNSLPKTVTRQRRGCDLNPGPSAPESSTLTTRLPRPVFRRITVASGASPASIVVVRDGCDCAFVDPSVSRDAALRDFSSVGRSVCSLARRSSDVVPTGSELNLPAITAATPPPPPTPTLRLLQPRSVCLSVHHTAAACVCVCVWRSRGHCLHYSSSRSSNYWELALRFAPARPRLAPSAHATQRLRPSAGSRQKYLRGPGPLPSP